MHFTSLGFSSSELGMAVAQAISHDIRTNHSGLDGFPQISVTRVGDDLSISLSWTSGSRRGVAEFSLSAKAAKRAVKVSKTDTAHDPQIFSKVKTAMAQLEHQISNSRVR